MNCLETSKYRKITERLGLRSRPAPQTLLLLGRGSSLPKNLTPAVGRAGLRRQNSVDPLASRNSNTAYESTMRQFTSNEDFTRFQIIFCWGKAAPFIEGGSSVPVWSIHITELSEFVCLCKTFLQMLMKLTKTRKTILPLHRYSSLQSNQSINQWLSKSINQYCTCLWECCRDCVASWSPHRPLDHLLYWLTPNITSQTIITLVMDDQNCLRKWSMVILTQDVHHRFCAAISSWHFCERVQCSCS